MSHQRFGKEILLTAVAVIGVLLSGCAKQPEPAKEAAQERAEQPAAEPAKPAQEPAVKPPVEEAPKPMAQQQLMSPSALNEQAPASFKVCLATSKGDVVVEVTRAWAPRGADRFYNLVKNGFYDQARFFRVMPNFIVQFGLPADPAVGRAWANATFRDDPVTQSNKTGTLVFATAGPNTRTTQLFINLKDNTFLDGQGFSPFGQVIEGMDVVQGIYSGYGEAPDQTAITNQGNAYLKARFPNLDYVNTATIE